MGCNVERGSWRIHCTNFWYHISPHASQRKSNNYTKSLILAKRLGRRPHFSSNIFSCKLYYFFFLNFCFSEKPEQSTHRVFFSFGGVLSLGVIYTGCLETVYLETDLLQE